MGYVKKERNIKRYKNFLAYYELTEKGQEWAEHIPEVLEEKRKRIHDAREKVLALCRNQRNLCETEAQPTKTENTL